MPTGSVCRRCCSNMKLLKVAIACLLAVSGSAHSATYVADMASLDDWTPDVWDDPDPGWSSSGGNLIYSTSTGNGNYFLRFDPPGSISGDVEILTKWSSPSAGSGLGVALLSAEDSDEDGYFVTLHEGTLLILGRLDAGEADYDAPAFEWTSATDYWIRFQNNATNVRVKVWEDGDAEPGSWTATYTNTTYNLGYVGLHAGNSGQVSTWSYFSVGTGGDPAPSPSSASIVPILNHHLNTLEQ
jgi:hypothetical protein